jgi:hypothetical protein
VWCAHPPAPWSAGWANTRMRTGALIMRSGVRRETMSHDYTRHRRGGHTFKYPAAFLRRQWWAAATPDATVGHVPRRHSGPHHAVATRPLHCRSRGSSTMRAEARHSRPIGHLRRKAEPQVRVRGLDTQHARAGGYLCSVAQAWQMYHPHSADTPHATIPSINKKSGPRTPNDHDGPPQHLIQCPAPKHIH